MKLLIIEDEKELRESIANFFKKMIISVTKAANKQEGGTLLLSNQFDIIVLDLTLPDGNGLDLLPLIKDTQNNAGTIILSAKNSIPDKVNGLGLGADDYLAKPFHLTELNARINALIRRKVFKGENIVRFNEISINTSENQAYVNDQMLSLTKKEFMLLLYFINNKNRVITKESIAEHLWGDDGGFIDNYDFMYAHIKNLRKKIAANQGKNYIKTVHGIGYKYTSA